MLSSTWSKLWGVVEAPTRRRTVNAIMLMLVLVLSLSDATSMNRNRFPSLMPRDEFVLVLVQKEHDGP